MATTAAMRGRLVQVKRGAVPSLVAGVRTKAITVNGSPIDITNDGDDGVRKLLDQPGQLDISISVSGVIVSEAFRAECLSTADRVENTTFLYGATQGFTGPFFLASYTETGEYQGAVTFEAEFQSAGAVTYVAT